MKTEIEIKSDHFLIIKTEKPDDPIHLQSMTPIAFDELKDIDLSFKSDGSHTIIMYGINNAPPVTVPNVEDAVNTFNLMSEALKEYRTVDVVNTYDIDVKELRELTKDLFDTVNTLFSLAWCENGGLDQHLIRKIHKETDRYLILGVDPTYNKKD